jgi:hypothetical protein
VPAAARALRRERPATTIAMMRFALRRVLITAKFLGYIDVPDDKAAIDAAAKEYKIAEALRDRLVARRDG